MCLVRSDAGTDCQARQPLLTPDMNGNGMPQQGNGVDGNNGGGLSEMELEMEMKSEQHDAWANGGVTM